MSICLRKSRLASPRATYRGTKRSTAPAHLSGLFVWGQQFIRPFERPRILRNLFAAYILGSNMTWTIYLSGEIHTDWRKQIEDGANARSLDLRFTSAVTDHDASDAAGDFLAPASEGFWRDKKSSGVNAIRTRTLIHQCDMAVIRFGDKYKQWNAAFDAGQCAALGKPYVTLHDEAIVHALKEVDQAANAWAQTPEQVVEILAYAFS